MNFLRLLIWGEELCTNNRFRQTYMPSLIYTSHGLGIERKVLKHIMYKGGFAAAGRCPPLLHVILCVQMFEYIRYSFYCISIGQRSTQKSDNCSAAKRCTHCRCWYITALLYFTTRPCCTKDDRKCLTHSRRRIFHPIFIKTSPQMHTFSVIRCLACQCGGSNICCDWCKVYLVCAEYYVKWKYYRTL